MLKDFFCWTDNGIYCPYGDFYLDAQQPVNNVIISHAHADHAVKNNQNIYCTAATQMFMKMRYKAFAGKYFYTFPYQETFMLNGIKISFHSAGHILGSAQILMEYKGVKYLYTGDFKTIEDKSCAAFEGIKADVLLTESTFANPNFVHPNPIDEIQKLNAISQNILLGAYSLGKSQRLIQLLQEHCPEKKILLHHNIFPFYQAYQKHGFQLGEAQIYGRKLIKSYAENAVYIVPPITFGSYIKAVNLKRIFATGWHKHHQGNDLALYISDHADWHELLKMIDESEAKYIITTHGDGSHLAAHYQHQKEIWALK